MMPDMLNYIRLNEHLIVDYIRRVGRIEAIKAMRTMFDKHGQRISTQPDIFFGETYVPTDGNLDLIYAKFAIDYVTGRESERRTGYRF